MEDIKIPKGWHEVYVDQFIELKKIDQSERGFYERQIEILSILNDVSSDDSIWEDIDVDELDDLIKQLSWIKREPDLNNKETIEDLTFISINKLTLGEFIDLDHYIVNDQYGNLYKICSILYKKSKLDDWGNKIFEPYGNIDVELRSKFFEELFIEDIYGVLNEFIQFKTMILEQYTNIFNPHIEEDTEPDDYEYSEIELDEMKREEEEEKEMMQWSWENIIYKLSDGDITKYDTITDLPLIFVLNQLSFMKRFKD